MFLTFCIMPCHCILASHPIYTYTGHHYYILYGKGGAATVVLIVSLDEMENELMEQHPFSSFLYLVYTKKRIFVSIPCPPNAEGICTPTSPAIAAAAGAGATSDLMHILPSIGDQHKSCLPWRNEGDSKFTNFCWWSIQIPDSW